MGRLILKSKHRVLCGDSTKSEDVARLMNGERAGLCFTSPPYNLGSNHHTAAKKTQAYADDMPEEDYRDGQRVVLDLVAKHCDGDLFYQHKNRIKNGEWLTPVDWIRRPPWKLVQEVVWINGGPNMDARRFYPQTERVYWLTREGTVTKFENVDHLTDWWQVSPVGTDGEHTRAFPVELAARILRATKAESILEPYSGSGTTLVACHQLNRRCLACDIEPAYVDVSIRRWQNLTGEQARLESTGETFAEREAANG